MKIDRRSFLSLVVGGAAGTALTPLPLKLTDDLSIWTQSFRYMPIEVPVPADGAVSHETSVCRLCPGGCGISVRKIDKRAVKIEGRAGHPVNDGGLCALGLAGLQLLYGPWRVQAPLKKTGDKFEKITWDQALSEIGARLNELREKGQAHTAAAITAGPGRNTTSGLVQRFLTAFGSSNCFSLATAEDALAEAAGKMLGVSGTPSFDVENSTQVVSFGAGLLDGWGSPVRMFQLNSRRQEKKTTLIQVESRLSNTAAKADTWIPINPGTEGILALGLAHVIVRDGLYVAGLETGGTAFTGFKQLLMERYTPRIVAQQTGVDEPTIEKLARNFAKAVRPLAICGRGNGQDPVGGFETMAVLALNILVGGVNRSGGLRLNNPPNYINWPAPELDAVAEKGLSKTRLDGVETKPDQVVAGRLHRLIKLINNNPQSPVQALFVAEANPVFTLHDSAAAKAAVEKIPLVVSLSAFMDETAACADYVLPLPTYLERYEDVVTTAGLAAPLLGLTRPVVDPVLDARHPGQVMIELAQALGGAVAAAFPWENYEDCLKQTLADQWDTLLSQGYAPADSAEDADATPAGAVNFSALVGSADQAAPIPGQDGAWPLTLIAYDCTRICGGHIGTPPLVLKIVPDTVLKKTDVFIDINPVTARRHGLADGRTAELETPAGKARVRIHLTEEIVPDVIAMPRGLGHSAFDDYLAQKGVNINTLVAPVEDPVSGLDMAWGIKAKLTQV